MDKNFLFNVGVTNAKMSEILEYILKGLKNKDDKYYIVTPNPEILVYANKHQEYKQILNNARLALCDGTGLIWAGKILGKNFKERTTGTDLMKILCENGSKQPITVGFLGAGPKIAEETAKCLQKKYPSLKVLLAEQGNPDQKTVDWLKEKMEETPNGKNSLKTSTNNIKGHQLDILFVAFGFPKQEKWIAENLDKLPVKVAIGVGGAFDYLSGNVSRAPQWIRKIGFEWLYRLFRQPWRAKRQLALLEFLYLVLKEKLQGNHGDQR